jgi:ABC-type branched-subunit amino acid transport system ATPase component
LLSVVALPNDPVPFAGVTSADVNPVTASVNVMVKIAVSLAFKAVSLMLDEETVGAVVSIVTELEFVVDVLVDTLPVASVDVTVNANTPSVSFAATVYVAVYREASLSSTATTSALLAPVNTTVGAVV